MPQQASGPGPWGSATKAFVEDPSPRAALCGQVCQQSCWAEALGGAGLLLAFLTQSQNRISSAQLKWMERKEALEERHVTSRIPYSTGPEHQSHLTGAETEVHRREVTCSSLIATESGRAQNGSRVFRFKSTVLFCVTL